MYKSRFDKWGFGKNTSKQDWQAFVILRDRAQTAGIDLRQIQVHSRIRSLPELEAYLRSQKISEADFLEGAMNARVYVPEHVRSIPALVSDVEQVAVADDVWQPIEQSGTHWINDTLTSLHANQGVKLLPFHSAPLTVQESSHSGNKTFEDSQLGHYHYHVG